MLTKIWLLILKGAFRGTMTDPSSCYTYSRDIYLDGYTYEISIQFPEEERRSAGTVPHNHSRYELHAVADGQIVLEFEDRSSVHLQKGDCYVIPPQIYHLRRVQEGAMGCFTMFISSSKRTPLYLRDVCSLASTQEIIRLFRCLEEEFKNRRVGSDLMIQSLCAQLLVSVLRELTMTVKPRQPSVQITQQKRDDLMDNYFATHYGQDIDMKDLAQKLGITTRQLSRIMQKRYGKTFCQHLLEIRLFHARNYLVTTELPLYRIAILCGFANQSAFSTAFRKCMGCSPTQYRKSKQE